MKIAILSHWRTYSSILARQFRAAGMEVGNEKTGWDPAMCEDNTELHALNHIAERYWKKKMELDEVHETLDRILQRFVEQAEVNGWEHYGFKITHAVFPTTFPIFVQKILKFWGSDTAFVTTICDPASVCWNTRMFKEWTPDAIYRSLAVSVSAVEWIRAHNGYVIRGPIDWQTGYVGKVAQKLGLDWTDEIDSMFDLSRMPPAGYKEEIEAKVSVEAKKAIQYYTEMLNQEPDDFDLQPQTVVVDEAHDAQEEEVSEI